MHRVLRFAALLPWLIVAARSAGAESFPPPKSLGDTNANGRGIQRTMTLLATSTPEKRHTVRVLFYGQSITEQRWSRFVAEDLRQRFPHAHLVITNLALGGFASQLLVKTAETDLYPFQPDLLIFHVYGSHLEYENIIRRVRERTTAEVLLQTDHLTSDADLTEEMDATKLTPKNWNAWMNHAFLPATARKYGCELLDQRTLWKQYLRDYQLPAARLLKDGVHLNAHGEYLMAEFVKAHLRHDPTVPADSWKDLVKTYEVGRDLEWRDGALKLDFAGSRVDVIAAPGRGPAAPVRIDGKRPSEFPALYGLMRTTAYPGSKWPCLLRVGSAKPLQVEVWTLTLRHLSEDHKTFRFDLTGSRTGPDGSGHSGEKFVSKSGRVVIEPEDWNLAYALKVHKRPLPPDFEVKWKVVPRFADEFSSPGVSDPTVETAVTLAQGLANTRHTLEISGSPETPIAAIRVYRPALK